MPPRKKTPASAGARQEPPRPPSTNAASPAAQTSRTYESTPVPQQVRFPARGKVVRTYGGRRSLPAALGSGPALSAGRRSLRQQTLTQIDYVRSSSSLRAEEEERGLLEEGDSDGDKDGDGVEQEAETEVQVKNRRASKRRKPTGGVPSSTPALERKVSNFHTQTLTQLLGGPEAVGGGLRVDDEEGDGQLPLPGGAPSPDKYPSPVGGGKGKTVEFADPRTPSHKRIKVSLDEVPSSQPTPFTPMLNRYSPLPRDRSPLTQRSTNLDATPPTVETASKLPRNLVIQDSYSMGSSEGFPPRSSVANDTPKKEEDAFPSQQPKREPLADITVASFELGGGASSQTPVRQPLAELPVASLELPETSPMSGEAPTTRRKRMFIEIPDSDDELESIGSTPLKARSTQQTPMKRRFVEEDFEILGDPGSGPQGGAVSGTPRSNSGVSSGKSDKENEDPAAIGVWEDGESTASEGEEPGTPTPTVRTRSQRIGDADRADQSSARTASQFWEMPGKGIKEAAKSSWAAARPSTELVPPEESVSEDDRPGTPTPAPREHTSQHRPSKGGLTRKFRNATPRLGQAEEPIASEGEEEHIPTSILRKAASQRALLMDERGGKPTTGCLASELPGGGEPGTSTPVVRRVQIALPPPSTAEEIYEETPRKAHKPSPVYQRHTQARSQYYSQGLESQRVPLQVIRSLGPQTDRSDILISIHPEIVDEIAKGIRDHEFRSYKFPIQVLRCWIYTTRPVGEVKFMATLGPAQEPGQIDSNSGLGNAEFNSRTSGPRFAHKLLQVYQLNNPVPLADMQDSGLGNGSPHKYRYLPPAIVGQLLANLRCALFSDEDEEEGKEGENEHDNTGVTISQELEEQLRSDIIHSTQMLSSERRHRHEEEDVIPASQSPVKHRSGAGSARQADEAFACPPPSRSSQRIRNRNEEQGEHHNYSVHQRTASTTRKHVRPSQATTASDVSRPTSRAASSSPQKSSALASVPRPPLLGSSEPPLPESGDMGDDGDGSLLPLPYVGSSSQAVLLPPDSLLMDEVRMAPPPIEVWDSEEDQ